MPEWNFVSQSQNQANLIFESPQAASWQPGGELTLHLTSAFKNAASFPTSVVQFNPVLESGKWVAEVHYLRISFMLIGTGPHMRIEEGLLHFDETAQILDDPEFSQSFTASLVNPADVNENEPPSRKQSQATAARTDIL